MELKQHPTIPEIFCTEDGRVFRELVPSRDSGGYAQIRNGTMRLRRHVLVCETFSGARSPGMVVRHLDGNRANDSATNLAWGTQAENCADTVEHGNSTRGEKNARSKITAAMAADIKARIDAGEGNKAIAADYGISAQSVCDIRGGRTWKWLNWK